MEAVVKKIKEISAGRELVLLVFGNAESMALTVACIHAVGADKLYTVHIDHGMLRRGELDAVKSSLENIGVENSIFITLEKFITVETVKTEDGRVIGPLSTVCDPFEKRYIISSAVENAFLRTVKENFKGDVCVFGINDAENQGVVIGDRAVQIASEAGASPWLLSQPFPMQALAIRMVCNDSVIAVTTEQRNALSELVQSVCGDRFFAKLAPLRSVGVRDGVRSYKSMAVLSFDGTDNNFETAASLARAIDRKLSFINRVVCRIDSDKKESTYHAAPMHITKETVGVIREVDAIVAEELCNIGATQFFAVLLPYVADKQKKYSVAIRAVKTDDFKTAAALVPGVDFDNAVLKRTSELIKKAVESVDMVFYDITSKPPAAIEFE